MATNAAEIYEEYIRGLPTGERIRLLALIADDLASERAATEKPPRHSLLDLHGLGKGVWEGVDAQEYVNRLRDGWHDVASCIATSPKHYRSSTNCRPA